jgi:hypothetical protein
MLSGKVTGEGIRGVLLELEAERASGELKCTPLQDQTERGFSKSIKIWNGNFCLATSSLSDDRLGEMLYRNSVLDLDTFVNLADRVSADSRFGDLLVAEQLTSPMGLWNYLREQSRYILHSLLRYDRLKVEFRPLNTSPDQSYPLTHGLRVELEQASRSAYDLKRFVGEIKGVIKFDIHEATETNRPDDFASEMASILRERGNFQDYLAQHSRASNERALDDLFEMFVRGYICNEIPFDRVRLGPGTAADIRAAVTWGNETLRRLHEHSMRVVSEQDWETIIKLARSFMIESFGMGLCMIPNGQMDAQAICRSLAFRPEVAAKMGHEAGDSTVDPSLSYVRRRVVQCLLYILFELYNRRAGSAELHHVHLSIDAERSRWH